MTPKSMLEFEGECMYFVMSRVYNCVITGIFYIPVDETIRDIAVYSKTESVID